MNKKGFTLMEVLIVVAIFAVMVTFFSSVLIISSRVYFESERTMEVMQNGRVFLDAISRELRQARRVVTSVPQDEESAKEEIIFQDGHLDEIREKEVAQGGSGNTVTLSDSSVQEDGFYNDAFIKIIDGPAELIGEKRKIIDYNGETRDAHIGTPFCEEEDYFGLEYLIDTSYYYINYFLDENGTVKRKMYAYYFSDDPHSYVPFDATPPQGESIEKEILESPRVIGEHFESVSIWEDGAVNVVVTLTLEEREVTLMKKIFGRNL